MHFFLLTALSCPNGPNRRIHVPKEDGKLRKYRHLNTDFYVVPIGIETLGSFGPHALDFIKDIVHRIVESTGEKRSTSYPMQTIGMAIQRANSSCILETVVDSRKLDEVYYL
jgi:hypothetical protein